MRRLSRVTAAGLGAAVILGVANADASHVVRIASHLSIRRHDLTFSGKVTSRNSWCPDQRLVTLYRTVGYPLGSIRTNVHGQWKIKVPASAITTRARVYAKVGRSSQGAAGTIYVCRAARSRTIRYRHS
jgi:hypothetical protein